MSKIGTMLGRAWRALLEDDDEDPKAVEDYEAVMSDPAPYMEQLDQPDAPPPIVAEVVARYAPENPLELAERKCREYFDVIERIERERNGWIEMYRTQVAEHLTAQSILERELMATRQTAQRAILMLNVLRKEKKLEPIQGTKSLLPYDSEPVGLVEKYAKRMMILRSEVSEPIDGLAEREAIRASD